MNYPNLRHVRAFVAVVETGSFIAAAEAVHLGQPALSQAIANLEEQIGVRLLERTSRSVRLTPAGEEFLVDARRVLGSVEVMMMRGSDWSNIRRGKIELLAIPSVAHRLLPFLVREFHRQHPEIEVTVHDDRDAALRLRLERGEGDLAILSYAGDASVNAALPFLRDRLRVVVPAKHRFASQDGVHASELADEPLILLRRGAVFRSYSDAALNNVVLTHPPTEVDQPGTLVGMVEGGLGIAMLPALSCPTPALRSMTNRPLGRPEVHRTIAFVQPPGRQAMPAVRHFVEICLAVLSSHGTPLPDGCDFLKPNEQKLRRFLNTPPRESPARTAQATARR